MDHVLDILLSYQHPCIILGCNGHRWMGSAGMRTRTCDMLIRDHQLKSIATDLIEASRWERVTDCPSPESDTQLLFKDLKSGDDADIILRKTAADPVSDYADYELDTLCLWSESTYRITVDDCPTVEVPDFHAANHVLIEETWHPAAQRTDGHWYGPCPHENSTLQNIPQWRTLRPLFIKGYLRGKSPSNKTPIFVSSLPTYLDALIYHATHYKKTKQGLWFQSSWEISNLTRYLYLELPHQQLPLLIELEEDKYMEEYLRTYVRKPRFVYHNVPGLGFRATLVREWDLSSFPDYPQRWGN